MFVKHSFGVKYPAEISPQAPLAGSRQSGLSHPLSRMKNMTAALLPNTFQPTITADGFAVDQAAVGVRALDPSVYHRRRLVVLALVLGMILGLLSFGRQADASPDPIAVAAEATVVVVQPGDTLWTIARAMQPEGDHRALVSTLSELTDGAVLQPGQRIVVSAALRG